MKRRRRFSENLADDDPLSLVPNLFDLSIVLAIAFLLTALGAMNISDLVQPDEEWMLIRKNSAGQTEVLSRNGESLQLQQLNPRKAGGQGMRLGVAYELDNGEVIYVPD
ncbi:DUF2149 domain-containing protein [Rubinisphaera brasiliensis]|uniref:DUF2149 domain-containing protein n=1 Tax=Rubinisphaera brasiliensis (strain ATCC 49424 / DSM 5305 / JCM 21570 / IAM 15109 / NBRC 103401 / IFAM 1448) TaxID=756272 RepID=F0SHE4_RUBBR|nr:DUF2149 domain-containing protein [Rubinisphaera brasiliensis]ADY61699.1 Protein of unknown function DUF2149 [Rubinisphaera brasiliensis DSM 5305]